MCGCHTLFLFRSGRTFLSFTHTPAWSPIRLSTGTVCGHRQVEMNYGLITYHPLRPAGDNHTLLYFGMMMSRMKGRLRHPGLSPSQQYFLYSRLLLPWSCVPRLICGALHDLQTVAGSCSLHHSHRRDSSPIKTSKVWTLLLLQV